MGTTFTVFFKKLLILTGITALIAFIAAFYLPKNFTTPALPFLFIFFVIVTSLVHLLLTKASEKNFQSFAKNFMIATLGKLILYVIVIIIYIIINRSDAIAFTINFFVLYLIYSVFEVISILFKTQKKNDKNH